MSDDLPFSAEYAKSGRAGCKKCKEPISKDTLRLAIMVQSPVFDGKMPMWHHVKCFFQKKNTLKSTAEIANFQNLRWEDQERISKHLSGKGAASGSDSSGNSDFSVEYAKSNRSACKGCGEKIDKGAVRISKLAMEEGAKYGPRPMWHHVDCFVKCKDELGFCDAADKIPGYQSLSEEDQQLVMAKVGSKGVKRASEDEPPTKAKKPATSDKVLKLQNKMIFDMRDNLAKHFTKKDMIELLEHNNQHISTGESRLLDHLADCLVFGGLKACPDCKNGRPRFLNNIYSCPGNLTEWTKCQYEAKFPEREKFVVPENFRESYSFLKDYKCTIRERRFLETAEPSTSKKSLPLTGYTIAVIGTSKFASSVRKKLEDLGAEIVTNVSSSVNLCLSTQAEVNKDSKKVKKARENDIHIVSQDFIDSVRRGSPVGHSIKEHTICSWGGDPILKFGIKKENGERKVKEENHEFKSSGPQKMKLSVKGAAAVDPESGLEHSCQVYQAKKDIYSAVLAYVDAVKGTNSFYKIQLLQANKSSKYYVFRQWGRVGTTIGGKKVENFNILAEAIEEFERLYKEKTKNEWWDRKNFVKKPGSMYPIDIDYGNDDLPAVADLKPDAGSKLPKSVQELICLIFDIEAMKKAMVEFEIDLNKMPLGKLSKKQIESAYKVLSEAQQILTTGYNTSKIMDVSNRFYTLIPHDFGMRKPPMLDDEELIKSKVEMLDSLLEIEFAYSMLKKEEGSEKDPVTEHYEKLNTEIGVVEKKSDEYNLILEYLTNTHAQTHNQYKLELKEVFKIKRHGEDERYKAFKDLHNKKLLWHGSRLTNYVGILSQGLRIAPPEAPCTGYMFGKGVYFADMVSKSANYCFTNRQNPTGLLLLCEVALGDMYEKKQAEFVEKLPSGKHSTKGLGLTMPDPKSAKVIDGVEVPCGKPAPANINQGALLYNEYIVYDVNQINLKYLLKVNFKWKY